MENKPVEPKKNIGWLSFAIVLGSLIAIVIYLIIAENRRIQQQEDLEDAIDLKIVTHMQDSLRLAQAGEARKLDSFYHTPAGRLKRRKEVADSLLERKKEIADSLKDIREQLVLKKIMEKYDCTEEQAESIKNKSVSLGMTKEMCIAAWGKPYRKHISQGNGYYQEQWVYNISSYLYFDMSGTLTFIQN